MLFRLINGVVMENLGRWEGNIFPLFLVLFLFILILNVAGLFSYIFTPTSHIVLTLGLSNSIVLGAIILGIGVFKGNFF